MFRTPLVTLRVTSRHDTQKMHAELIQTCYQAANKQIHEASTGEEASNKREREDIQAVLQALCHMGTSQGVVSHAFAVISSQ